ncbi:MAG: YSC84-related protein [Planctomycetota bacterium]
MPTRHLAIVLTSASGLLLTGCAAQRLDSRELASLERDVDSAVEDFIDQDPSLERWFEDSYGFAIFPNVGKGGIGIGGAYGEGLVYELGEAIGSVTLTQATIGFQLGGQSYQQVVFFEAERFLEEFISGEFEFNAQASVVAATAGASADATFDNGMLIVTAQNGGLMYEASVGGQTFKYRTLD